MKTQNLLNVAQIEANLIDSNNEKIQQIIHNQKVHLRHLKALELELPLIEKALNKVHLTIGKIGYHKTGSEQNWTENNSLSVNITASPTSEKFKFLTFKGFDRYGNGKNQKALDKKATKIADTIRENTNIESANVNPYSLEIKNSEDRRQILIGVWIKA